MKLVYAGEKLVIYLNNIYINTLDFSNKELLQKYLKNLLLKMSNIYNLEFDGYYAVRLFVDKNYGVIIEIKKEELEYLDYFSNQFEMSTEVVYGSFLYEVYNFDEKMCDKFIVYKLNDKLYLRVKKDISDIEIGSILEHSKIIYGKEASNIIKTGKIVR